MFLRCSNHAPLLSRASPATRNGCVRSVRIIVAAGAPVLPRWRQRIERRFRRAALHWLRPDGDVGMRFLVLPDDEPDDRYNTIGRPVAQTDMKVIDPATGETVAPTSMGSSAPVGIS